MRYQPVSELPLKCCSVADMPEFVSMWANVGDGPVEGQRPVRRVCDQPRSACARAERRAEAGGRQSADMNGAAWSPPADQHADSCRIGQAVMRMRCLAESRDLPGAGALGARGGRCAGEVAGDDVVQLAGH